MNIKEKNKTLNNYKDKHHKRVSKLYGNCEVYSPKGNLMFLCLEKKANWYLNKKLAKKIHDPITNIKLIDTLIYFFGFKKDNILKIKLTFEPKNEGNKDDLYSLSKKENRCVITGSLDIEDLTRHHIVPHCYRKHMPEQYKTANSHDIVPICIDKHLEYEEKYATKLKNKIGEEYGVPLNGALKKEDEVLLFAYRAANTLSKNADKIPEDIKEMLLKRIKDYLLKDEIIQEDIDNILKLKATSYIKEKDHAKTVINAILENEGEEGLERFIRMWRQDFIDNAKPSYMPKHWDINRPGRRLN